MALELPLTSAEHAARYRALGLWRDRTIAERFLAAATAHSDKLAIVEKTRRFTYSALRQLIHNVAGHLLDFGLRPGEVIALQCKNCAELPIVHLACNLVGVLLMPLHDSWREAELCHLLGKAHAKLVIVPREYRGFDYAAMLADVRNGVPSLERVVILEGEAPGCDRFESLIAPTAWTPSQLHARRPDADLPAAIMLSGGTTALSKISRFSSNDLLVMLDNFAASIELASDDIAAALAPAGTGATGYVFPILTPLLHGATSVILERWSDPQEAVDLIMQERCTYAVGIPTQLTRMLAVLEKHRPEDFPQFRCFFNSGAAMPFETGLRIEQMMNCVVQSMYGSTDGGVPTVMSIRDPQEKRLRTVGRAVAGCECQLWDAAGLAVAPGEQGEIVWRGADKSWGYLGDDEQTAAAFTADHFYRSGDLGCFDADGYLSIVGRVKDMILRGGRNIFPRTIEELLAQHSAVLEVTIAAMPDPVLGERACAFVMLRCGHTLDFQEMIEFLQQRKIAVWQLPERLEIVSDLPRSPGGKIVKAKLTEMIAAKLKAEQGAANTA